MPCDRGFMAAKVPDRWLDTDFKTSYPCRHGEYRSDEGSERIPSFGQSCGRGLGRRTTWRRLGGSCAMTSDFSRRIMMTYAPPARQRRRMRVARQDRPFGQRRYLCTVPWFSPVNEDHILFSKLCKGYCAPS